MREDKHFLYYLVISVFCSFFTVSIIIKQLRLMYVMRVTHYNKQLEMYIVCLVGDDTFVYYHAVLETRVESCK